MSLFGIGEQKEIKEITEKIAEVKNNILRKNITHEEGVMRLTSMRNEKPKHLIIIDGAIAEIKNEVDVKKAKVENVQKAKVKSKENMWELDNFISNEAVKMKMYATELADLDENSREYKQKYKEISKIYEGLETAEKAKDEFEAHLEKVNAGTSAGGELSNILKRIIESTGILIQDSDTEDVDIETQMAVIRNLESSKNNILEQFRKPQFTEDTNKTGAEQYVRDQELKSYIANQSGKNGLSNPADIYKEIKNNKQLVTTGA